jgi:pimeloyl-ACP methyl ester carboxylesterase
MWVDAARRCAAQGLSSYRVDLLGIGESDGAEFLDIPSLYQEALVEQVERTISALRDRNGFQRFAVAGLCAGAFWAFHAAIRNPAIVSAILLNPRMFFWDAEVDRRRMLRRGAKGLVSWKDWSRLLRGGVQVDDLKRAARLVLARSRQGLAASLCERQIPAGKLSEAWRTLTLNRTQVTLVFTEGEPLLSEMEQEHQLPPEGNARIRIVRVPSCGHTFRPQWSQRIVNEVIYRELENFVSTIAPDHVLKGK